MKLNNDVITLFNLFSKAGHKLYIIGGAVRDYLLNKEIEDYDFATTARPSEIINILSGYSLDTFQEKLGSIKVHLNNKVYEITTFRKEVGVKDFRYPNEVVFVDTLKEDVLRRDFTINALAFNIDEGIVDYLDGISDLNNKVIKFIKSTKNSINEDPIRLIRALRFSKTLDFNICDEDLLLFKELAYKVNDLGKIKYDELLKLFKINGCKDLLTKFFDIYKKAYPDIFNDKFKEILQTNINNLYLKFIICYINPNVDLSLNKNDRLVLDGLNKINCANNDLYYTKLLMIEYKEHLNTILEILSYINEDVYKIIENVKYIQDNNCALGVKDLDINYLDLESLGVAKNNYSKVLKYLLDEVLHNDKLNNKEDLIRLIDKKDD
jgi:tRNA nucleotidyltransferase (CCA-adding enzyme)